VFASGSGGSWRLLAVGRVVTYPRCDDTGALKGPGRRNSIVDAIVAPPDLDAQLTVVARQNSTSNGQRVVVTLAALGVLKLETAVLCSQSEPIFHGDSSDDLPTG
jgi:hypothetical protein